MDNVLTTADETTLAGFRDRYRSAEPFPHIVFDDFLTDDWATRVAESYPDYESALGMGRVFESVNEHRKLQIPDSSRFAPETRASTSPSHRRSSCTGSRT